MGRCFWWCKWWRLLDTCRGWELRHCFDCWLCAGFESWCYPAVINKCKGENFCLSVSLFFFGNWELLPWNWIADFFKRIFIMYLDVGTWDIQFSFVHYQFLVTYRCGKLGTITDYWLIKYLQWHQEPREVFINEFLMDIKDYTASISDCTAPVGIIVFGVSCCPHT